MKKIIRHIVLLSTALMAANFTLAPLSGALAAQPATTTLQENLTPEEQQSRRLEIFEKVLNLSIKETEGIINQLKALENLDEKNSSLREQFLEKFSGFLEFYEEQKKNLENPEEIDLAKIKNLAQSLKDWRENVYLPALKTAIDFLLINQQKIALEIAEKRHKKISADVEKLLKINLKGSDNLKKMSEQAADSINQARDLYLKAESDFWLILETASTTASSTILMATSSQQTATTTEETTASTTISTNLGQATSTATTTIPAAETEDQFLSIKNLVGQSLNKIKEAYKIFIEMSNFVKKLLI